MCRDKILRVLGRDPNAGLAQAREWMTSPDPVMVDNARVVFQDIGGHDEDARAAKLQRIGIEELAEQELVRPSAADSAPACREVVRAFFE